MKLELRNDRVIIDGYVNAVGRDSKHLRDEEGEFVEQIVPGTFARAIQNALNPIRILRDHKSEWFLGDTSTNLQLEEDTIGLHAHAEITDAETIEKARNKKLKGWSFGFIPLDRKTEYTFDGTCRRLITELVLNEVSIIDDLAFPAYSGTSVKADCGDNEEGRSMESKLVLRMVDTEFEIIDNTEPEAEVPDEPVDYGYYRTIIKILE